MQAKIASNIYGVRSVHRTLCSNAGVKNPDLVSEKESLDKPGLTDDIPQYDIAIVGGGMVGMALACSLATMPLTKQLSVAIIDSNPALVNDFHIKKEDPPDPRVSTVTPATISFFKVIWVHRNLFSSTVMLTSIKCRVWDYTGLGYTRYNARDVDADVLRCVAENKVLHKSLLSCVQNMDFQKTIYSSRLSAITFPARSSVTSSSGTSSSASGSSARLELDNGNSMYVKLELLGQNHLLGSWQEYKQLDGSENYSNIVWSMDPKESVNRNSMSEDDFVNAVNDALDSGYGPHPQSKSFEGGNIFSWLKADGLSSTHEGFKVPPKVLKLASQRLAFPLSLMHANSYASKRLILIGDAAHTVHPLAGQGVNMGFADARSLSKVIAEGVAVGSDIGEVTLLKRYESERKAANITLMAILDGFQKAYSIDFMPINVLRALAFNGAQYISPLKRKIISYASGYQLLLLFSHDVTYFLLRLIKNVNGCVWIRSKLVYFCRIRHGYDIESEESPQLRM
ncbi:hypothetical protein P3S68_023351 [Capsicum galapagoense]